MRTHFPPGPLLGAVIRLSFGTWIGLRLLLAAGLAWGGGGPLELALVAQLLVPAVVAGAVWLQLGRRGEQLLLRSLGIGPFGVALPAMAVASIGEIVIAVLIR